ncbi:MAG: phosphatase PAP2 family protein [Ferruginibacter sp.]
MNIPLRLDKELFGLINGSWHNETLDVLMPFLRNSNSWMPLYLFLLVFALTNFKKNTWWWIFFAAGTVIVSNFISADIIKELIFRIRPCNDAELAGTARVLVTYRPQSSGFVSSHAANHFAMAAFFYYTLKDFMGKWALLFFLWAFSICYAQVYVGVHFPIDVICGGVIGFVFGYLSAGSFNKNYDLV